MINYLFLFYFGAQKYTNIPPNTICISIPLKEKALKHFEKWNPLLETIVLKPNE